MNNPMSGTDPTGYACTTASSALGSCGGAEVAASVGGESLSDKGFASLEIHKDGRGYVTTTDGGLYKINSVKSGGISGSSSLKSEKNKVGKISTSGGRGQGSSGSLSDQIKADSHAAITRMAGAAGADVDYGSTKANWRSITQDSDGKVTAANVHCDSSCRLNAGTRARDNASNLRAGIMRISYLQGQRRVAHRFYQAIEYSSYVFLAGEVAAASAARWALMRASDKIAYFMVVGDGVTLATGGASAVIKDAAMLGLYQNSKTLIPRMTLKSTSGKPVVRNGKFVVD